VKSSNISIFTKHEFHMNSRNYWHWRYYGCYRVVCDRLYIVCTKNSVSGNL